MKKYLLVFFCSFLLAIGSMADNGYESLKIINSTNWVRYFDDLLGYRYDSHGCLHFSPSDIYLLYKTIPAGIPLTIKKYRRRENDPPFSIDKVPYLADKTNSPRDIQKHALIFKNYKTEIVDYPSLNLLFILVNGYPYAKVKALAGPPYDFLAAFDVRKEQPVFWDFMLSTPTDPGGYKVLRVTDHYLSNAYYQNTVVPFGAWIKKVNGKWVYQENRRWYKLPPNIIADLRKKRNQRVYNYYDINLDSKGKLVAARYAGHDFGKYVLLWTRDGSNHYPEMGYAAGELVYEQIILIKDLVYFLTRPSTDDFNSLVEQNSNFTFYKSLYEFKISKGEKIPSEGNSVMYSYYKLFKGFELRDKDYKRMDPRVVRAFDEYRENRLPRNKGARRKALGLYNFLRVNSLVIDKQAYWYEKIKKDWKMLKRLKVKLRGDFDKMGVLSLENRQNVIEGWLDDRLEFKKAALPKQAKYLTDLSFSAFFKPDEETALFTERERSIMLERIRKTVKEEGEGLNLRIVDALNNYNFGLLLNEILGDLYKSHGCMHVSPRDAIFVYNLLPVGSQITVYEYSKKISEEELSGMPFLADMVNFTDDLERLKEEFANTSEVQVAVYPSSGDWIVYIKKQPFARLRVRGGPQSKLYLLQGREKDGKPIFEKHLAYPTTPGNYYIFRKVENYISSIYYDQTIIPMGGIIRKYNDKWIFQDKKGNWKNMPGAVVADLKQPPVEREYIYYDTTKNTSGEVIEMKWGSHPFGKYSLQTTLDGKTPWPELIHSSGDLMMEERQLISDLIKVLTAPHDKLETCVKYSQNFDLYKVCYDFVNNPKRDDLIQTKGRAAYKLYHGMPMSSGEVSSLPKDIIIANKILHKKKLTNAEIRVLINEGIAYRRSGKLKINMEKILGLQFDTYQYVVTIQKYAHHYGTLNKYWNELSGLRRALLKDFNAFVIKDVDVFHDFMRELMLKRTKLERLTQKDALQALNDMLEQAGL